LAGDAVTVVLVAGLCVGTLVRPAAADPVRRGI
jgi:hypothetical protein